jgi:hypothetical protein
MALSARAAVLGSRSLDVVAHVRIKKSGDPIAIGEFAAARYPKALLLKQY